MRCALFQFIAILSIVMSRSACAFDVDASAPIPPSSVSSYSAKNLSDRNIQTAWCSNNSLSSSLSIGLKYSRPTQRNGLGFINGYAKSKSAYLNNARPKKISIFADGKLIIESHLADTTEPQWIAFSPLSARSFKIVVSNIYEGTKYTDVCVTEVFDDRRIVDGYRLLEVIDRKFGNRSLSPEEIMVYIKPIYDQLYHPNYDGRGPYDVTSFWDTVDLRSSRLDTRGLRLMLDLIYYSERNIKNIDAELLEGLRDSIVPYIENNKEVVIDVINDAKQVKREAIANAYYSLIGNFIYDPKTQEITDPLFTKDLRDLSKYMDQISKRK